MPRTVYLTHVLNRHRELLKVLVMYLKFALGCIPESDAMRSNDRRWSA